MNQISDEQLEYKHHIKFYEKLGNLVGDDSRDRYWHQQAEYFHALSVCDGILDLYVNSIALAQKIGNSEADFQLRFGVARRAKFIWLSLRNLISLAHPEREEPLLHDQVEEAARDLNVIYINIRGVLDNYAALLVALLGSDQTRRLRPMQVALFGAEFLKDRNLVEVADFLAPFMAWNVDLKGRRDPAAHRIPLSIPPALIDGETREEFESVNAAYQSAIVDLNNNNGTNDDVLMKAELVNAQFGRLERVGKFVPLFVHHPDEGVMKIYPTVPEDVGHLVKIGRGLGKIIAGRTLQG